MRLSGRTRRSRPAGDVDESFLVDPDDTVASVLAAHADACAASRRVAADLSLDTTVEHPRMGTLDLRWIYLHLVREIARHLGHGDILREQLSPKEPTERQSPDGPCSSSTLKPASSRIGTPSCSALSALEPALSPTTT